MWIVTSQQITEKLQVWKGKIIAHSDEECFSYELKSTRIAVCFATIKCNWGVDMKRGVTAIKICFLFCRWLNSKY